MTRRGPKDCARSHMPKGITGGTARSSGNSRRNLTLSMPPGCPLRAVLCRSWLRSVLVNSDAIGGQIECKRVVKWRAVFQLVFQLKIKTDINFINQYLTERIQITPAHQSENDKARQVRALLHPGFGIKHSSAPSPASSPSNAMKNPEPPSETILVGSPLRPRKFPSSCGELHELARNDPKS